MDILKAEFEKWQILYAPDDGARILELNYAGHKLLTPEPAVFRPPDRSYGEFETRPVYGYDDCFPTVDPCTYPGNDFECRDHGQLCWQKWDIPGMRQCSMVNMAFGDSTVMKEAAGILKK